MRPMHLTLFLAVVWLVHAGCASERSPQQVESAPEVRQRTDEDEQLSGPYGKHPYAHFDPGPDRKLRIESGRWSLVPQDHPARKFLLALSTAGRPGRGFGGTGGRTIKVASGVTVHLGPEPSDPTPVLPVLVINKRPEPIQVTQLSVSSEDCEFHPLSRSFELGGQSMEIVIFRIERGIPTEPDLTIEVEAVSD